MKKVIVIGNNGSGKTTMIKVLTCLLNKYDITNYSFDFIIAR